MCATLYFSSQRHTQACSLQLWLASWPSWSTVVVCRGTELAATCDKELAAFLTQQQQPAAADKQQQKPFSSFLATTLMLMSELAKVCCWAVQGQLFIATCACIAELARMCCCAAGLLLQWNM